MKHPKRKFIGILVAVLVVALMAGGTLAYLTARSESRANNFTLSARGGLDAQLIEPEWDGIIDYVYSFGEQYPVYAYDGETPIFGYTNNDPSRPITDISQVPRTKDNRPRDPQGKNPLTGKAYGDDRAILMVPGASAPKNPMIRNIGIQDEWVAAKITYVYNDGEKKGQPLSLLDYLMVTELINVNYNTTQWESVKKIDGGISEIFYYKEIVPKGTGSTPGVYPSTVPLFTTVSIDLSVTNAELKQIEDIGGFIIYVEGFAAPASSAALYTDPANQGGFKEFGLNGGVWFDNTPTADAPLQLG